MFHRVPFISTASVVTAAVILVLAALFALPLSSPGTALAEVNRQAALDQETLESKGDIGFPVSTQDPDAGYRFSSQGTDLPEVSIYAVMPEVGEEDRSITVTLKLSRPLRSDEKYCYRRSASDGNDGTVCIEGGIIVWDTYDDHLYEEGGSEYENGFIPSNELVKFVFRGTEVEKRLSVSVHDDECITPERTIRVAINQAFDSETYGYTINPKDNPEGGVLVPIDGNDTVNGTLVDEGGDCAPVEDDATEEFIYNHAPQFDGDPPTYEIAENTAANQGVGDPVTATDPDNTAENPNKDSLTYSLQGQDASSFTIDLQTGQIKTKDALDHETKDTYHVAVFVRDSRDIRGNPDTVDDNSIDVTINVTDVNEPPEFDANAPASLNVIENTTAGTDIGSPVTATDPDNTTANPTKDTLTYSLDTGDGASFEIDSSGQIKTKDPLDRETKDTYTVTVSVSDSKDATGAADSAVDDSHTVTITIDNEVEPPTFNEEPPQGQNSLARSVAENTPAGQPVGDPVSATSEDGVSLTYSLGGTDAASFDIDTGTGQIKTKAALDYEDTQNIYSVTVSVTDSKDANGNTEGTPTEDARIDITISVTDVNEPPQFAEDAPTTQTVDENTAAGTNIGNPYTATDPDDGDTPTYSLDDGDGAAFEIDSSGQIKTKDALNHETKASYTVTVSVSDNKDATGSSDTTVDDTRTVTITVTNIVEPPTFDEEIPQGQTSLSRSIPENTTAGRPIGDPVSATDEEDDTLTYSLDDQDGASFEVDANGQIKTKDPLDYEDKSLYLVTVSVTDSFDANGDPETPGVEDDTIAVTINVTDLNEKPVFAADAPITQTVAENAAADTNIGSAYTATDPENDALAYTLDSGSAATFEIDANGQLKTKADLNYEADSSYTVIVQVTDSRDDNGVADTAIDAAITVTITVTDEDDPGSITFSSDPPIAGTTLAAVLEDQDGVKSDVAVTWKWEISADQTNWNTITDATTDSYTPGSDDIGDYLRVTATYDDEKGPGKTVETETDAVLTAPATNTDASFADLDATRSVPENTAAGQPIGAPVAAVDPDYEDTLTYSLGGTDAASFDIDTSNGQLKTKDALDFDGGQTTYSVDVSVTDSKDDYDTADTLVDATIAVTINITDVNEKPVFADAPPTQNVNENTAADTNIGSAYTATDPDAGDTLTYSLGGADAASFAIDDSTGQLKTNADLDYEDDSSYTVIVRVTDSKDDNGVADTETDAAITVTITVTDVDDPGTITFSADPPSAGTALTATLNDDDAPISGETWEWQISDDGQSNWSIITGADINSYVPQEAEIGRFLRIEVEYTDSSGGNKSATADTAEIDTAPTTNEHPAFADSTITREVAENAPAGQNIGDPVAATHADSVGTLVYSLDATGASNFDIDSSTGQLKTKTVFDYETDGTSYTLTVSASDGMDSYSNADTAVDATITVTINVTDVNEPPQFDDSAVITVTVTEDLAVGQNVGDALVATDPDSGDTVTYSVSGIDADLFVVDSGGQLLVKEALDYENSGSLTVIVNATDSRDDSGTAEQTPVTDDSVAVTITVTNVFEAPRFDEAPQGESSITLSVPENTPADQPVGDPVSATDDEGDTLTFSLDGSDASSFDIDASNGQIKTKHPLNYESQSSYSVSVSVSDGKDDQNVAEDPPLMDTTIEVTIEVIDVNEDPVFDATPPIEYEIAENTAADSDIGAALSATDPDPADTLTYGLEGTDADSFTIVSSTGQIKTKADLDHETTETYNVSVTVRDSRDDNGEADTATDATIEVTITVTDEDDPGTISLSPIQPSAGDEVTATLEDDDGIKTSVDVTWKWESSPDQTTWTVIEGETSNTYIPQQGDIGYYLRVTADYEDELGAGKTAEKETDSAVLTMEATNELPAFDASLTTTLSVQENTPAGETIGNPFTATDADDSSLTYSLGGTDSAEFAIVDTTGQIQAKEVLDYETANNQTSYSVTVEVRDSRDPFGNTDTRADDTIDVTINVTDMVVPDVPEEPTVSATQGAAADLTVTWEATEPEDNSPVDGYDVQYRVKDATPPDWGSANVTVTGATATITGLEYSTTYEVEVRSKNVEGNSEWSPTGEGTIPSSLSVSFSSGSQTVDEGSSATFTVTVSPAADRELSIPISATRGTAEADDYSVSGLTNGTLTFDDTESSKTFTVSTNTDPDRNDETVDLAFGQLPAAVGTGTPSTAQLTINDTTPAPRGGGGGGGGGGGTTPSSLSVSFGQAIYTVTEGNTSDITVNVSPAADRALSIPISATQGSAESDDYSEDGTPLTFALGDTAKTFTVSTISDSDRDDETVKLAFGELPAAVGTGTAGDIAIDHRGHDYCTFHQRCAGIRLRRNNHAVRPREHPGGREHRRPIHGHG